MAQERQLREIVIKVDAGKSASDLKAIANSMGGFQKSLKETSSSMSTLKNLVQGFFAASIFGLGIREITGFSDSMQQLNDRIRILSPSTKDADTAFSGLLNSANKTKTSVDGLATVYSRLAASTTETGISTKGLLDLTEILQNTFRLSGATTQEAVATSVQLSQAFASGQVRGQELRSVMEQNVYVAKLLRKEFGPDIYEKAAKGMIKASDVLRILFENQGKIEQQAKELGQTFEQTLIVAFNKLKFAIFEINKEFGVSGKFAEGMDIVSKKAGVLATIVGGSLVVALGYLAAKLSLMAYASLPLLLTPLGALVTALGAGAAAMLYFGDTTNDVLRWVNVGAQVTVGVLADLSQALSTILNGPIKYLIPGLFLLRDAFGLLSKELRGLQKDLINEYKQLTALPAPTDTLDEIRAFEAAEKERAALMKRTATAAKTLKEEFIDLNTAFLKGKISTEDYFVAIQKLESSKLEEKFVKGKLSLDKYREGLSELKKMDINRDFNSSAISVSEFNDAVRQNSIEDLNNKLQTGKINLIEYNKELTKISDKVSPGGVLITGTAGYLESVGTTASQVAKAIEGAFSGLETALTEFIQKGSQDWKKFAQGILDDLTRIIVRASIVQPLANALIGAVSPKADAAGGTTSYSSNYLANAHGNVFDRGLKKFASGGVVSSPTLFGYGKSSTGLMGEAGPEAILPLSRGRNGDLGVQANVTPVTVNIVNNTGANVEQRETVGPDGGRVLDVIISRKVNDGIASGTFDKVFASSYGLRRRG